MNIYATKEYAKEMLSFVIEKNCLGDYILGITPFSIKINGSEECIYAKMEAIYDYYKNESTKISNDLFTLMDYYTKVIKGSNALINLIRIIEYQMVAENEKRAPFCLDIIKLLTNLKQNFSVNKALYQSPRYNEINFWNVIEQYDNSFNLYLGYKIL